MAALFPTINILKTIVSKNRNRHKESGFDLDLTYITERIIAMAYPAERVQSMFRNHLNDVYDFLELKHKDHYFIYNLCSERSYDRSKFCNRVKIYPFDDHNPPSFVIIRSFCEDVHRWLEKDPRNVIAIHCKAGKGRTGTMICCYLLHCGMYERADDAIEFYGKRRTQDGQGVTIPSQIRYIKYYEQFLRDNLTYQERPIFIKRVQIKPAPKFSEPVLYTVKQRMWTEKKRTSRDIQENDSGGESSTIDNYEGKHYEMKTGYKSANISFRSSDPEVVMDYPEIRTLHGDISIELFYRSPVFTKKKRFARIWINSFFADLNGLPVERTSENRFRHLVFKKQDIDIVWKKDKKNRMLSENCEISVYIKVPTTDEELRVAQAEERRRDEERARLALLEAQNEDTSGAEDTSEDENDWESVTSSNDSSSFIVQPMDSFSNHENMLFIPGSTTLDEAGDLVVVPETVVTVEQISESLKNKIRIVLEVNQDEENELESESDDESSCSSSESIE